MSQVVKAAPRVPQIKSGVARLVAAAPKVRLKRDKLVGKIDDVPKPAMAAPTLKNKMSPAKSIMTVPSKTVSKFSSSNLFSFKKRRKSGAIPRPTTKNKKYKSIGESKTAVGSSSKRCV